MAVLTQYQLYNEQESTFWPTSGHHILAQYDETSIVVYQAYNTRIAAAIVKNQNFHSEEVNQSGFSLSRMTWIKPNFLWMMYRSGWASKRDQQVILALKLSRVGFETLLTQSISTSVKCDNDKADVRLQWDPDHKPDGKKHSGRRAIQLGIRGEMLIKLSKEFLLGVEDITHFVHSQSDNATYHLDRLLVPKERIYEIQDENIKKLIKLD